LNDIKRDYLIRTFSRTKRKDYENYIINAIWHKLGNNDIQPTTQQYIMRSDGRFALVDLCFPQLNIGIECDEAYHIDNKNKDAIRTMSMEDMLNSYEETQDFKWFRVAAYESLESIDSEIDKIVTYIKK